MSLQGFKGPIELSQFGHGQSNPTYMVTRHSSFLLTVPAFSCLPTAALKVKTAALNYVLRKQPPGTIMSKTAHRVDREYQIMQALADTPVPVPKVYGLCMDESVLGKPFYLCECIEGRIFKDVTLPDVPKAERKAYWMALVSAMAAMHNVDYKAVGLTGYGKDSGYFERQTRSLSAVSKAQRDSSPQVPAIPDFEAIHPPAWTHHPPWIPDSADTLLYHCIDRKWLLSFVAGSLLIPQPSATETLNSIIASSTPQNPRSSPLSTGKCRP